jgi:ribonuclease T
MTDKQPASIKTRFGNYLPIVVDLETSGVNPLKDAILEIAAVVVTMDEKNKLQPSDLFACHVMPFEGAHIDPAALAINRIDPYHPFRFAIDEKKALNDLFNFVADAVDKAQCHRALLVGHNAHFDLSFIQATMRRCKFKKSPFHAFTCFDTATLAGVVFGKTILAKALQQAKIPFDKNEAHSAIYDAKRTAELFCYISNRMVLQES